MQFDDERQDVHVFRVDQWKTRTRSLMDKWTVKETLARIHMTDSGEVPSQTKRSLSYGCLLLFGPFFLGITNSHHPVVLRLYRPGYELLEIQPGEQLNPVWVEAADIAAQQQALRALFPIERLAKVPGENPVVPLPFGDQLVEWNRSRSHRDALLFGASEYERLMALSKSNEQRDDLHAAAAVLRKLAER